MLFEELRIRDVVIRPAHILAPMAGITDTVFRRFIKRLGGCGLIMTEFVSSEGMLRQNLRSKRYLYYTEEERPISAQLFGADPDHLAEAARVIEELGFNLVDLNLGCPAKKVVKCGGSGLLRDLPLLEKILRKIRAAVRIPFTIKFRSGWSEAEIVALQVARMAEECGVEALSVHPRTRLQGFSGQCPMADYPRGEVPGAHPGNRQRRRGDTAGRPCPLPADRLRCRDDRARRRLQSMDIPPAFGFLPKRDIHAAHRG